MLNPLYQHLPNIVSSIRILMAPVLLYLAIEQQPTVFIIVLIFTELTDVLDGYLARRLKLVSKLGAQLDSWGDFFVYITMTVSAWLLWPDVIVREQIYVIIIISSFTLPVLIGLIKFRTWTSYHTVSTKIAVIFSVSAYVLLFTGFLDWLIIVAVIFCLYAAMEQILITLLCDDAGIVDVKSIWHALREKNNKDKSETRSI